MFPGPIDAEIAEFLRLDLALDEPLDLAASSAYLLGNVVAASHGETVRAEVLGNGDASASFQRFALKKQPLTYLPSEQEGGVESTLEVRVNDVLWDGGAGPLPPAVDCRDVRHAHAGRRLHHRPVRRPA